MNSNTGFYESGAVPVFAILDIINSRSVQKTKLAALFVNFSSFPDLENVTQCVNRLVGTFAFLISYILILSL